MADLYSRDDIPVMDLDRVHSLFGLKEGFFQRVVDAFMQSSPHNIEGIQRTFKSAELEDLRKYSHTLKGAAGNIGGTRLSAICADLEAAAKDGNVELCGPIVGHAVNAYQELTQRLRDMLEEG